MHNHSVIEKGVPLVKAEKAFLFLHGRGGTASDIIQLMHEFPGVTYYYAAPQAAGNTWYPYTFLSPVAKNEPWLSSAIEVVKRLCDDIAGIIGTENIYLMGFSQGACLALEFASRNATRYGGIAAFSGGLIGDELNTKIYSGNFRGAPVFIGNSDSDPHIPVSRCKESKDIMLSLGAKVELTIYPDMPHYICNEEIDAVRALMNI